MVYIRFIAKINNYNEKRNKNIKKSNEIKKWENRRPPSINQGELFLFLATTKRMLVPSALTSIFAMTRCGYNYSNWS